mmetsp:Transcript_103249/g.210643  ORF Transcript_103249/g.210643 Transcript_103249/m.210643 type:complete len:227 (+) Transcript_103249:1533-2213(+)
MAMASLDHLTGPFICVGMATCGRAVVMGGELTVEIAPSMQSILGHEVACCSTESRGFGRGRAGRHRGLHRGNHRWTSCRSGSERRRGGESRRRGGSSVIRAPRSSELFTQGFGRRSPVRTLLVAFAHKKTSPLAGVRALPPPLQELDMLFHSPLARLFLIVAAKLAEHCTLFLRPEALSLRLHLVDLQDGAANCASFPRLRITSILHRFLARDRQAQTSDDETSST